MNESERGADASHARPSPGDHRGNRTEPERRARGGKLRKCILHIGTEKTGTSSIQKLLCENRRALLRQGILYPQAAAPYGGSQWEFVACAHDSPWSSDIGRQLGIADAEDLLRFRNRFARELADEIVRAGAARTLLVSSEHMHSRLPSQAQIATLKRFLEPFAETFEVVVYLRRQDRMSLSFYLHQIRMGQDSPSVFPAGEPARLAYYDHERLFDNWVAVFGEDAMRVRLFSADEWPDRDLIADFCATCGIDPVPLARSAPLNESVTMPAAQFLGELNRQARLGNLPAKDIALNEMTVLISQLFRDDPKPVSRDAARNFYARFVESNERLRRRALPERRTPLFDNDFSDYPEQPDALASPTHADAVAIAMALWNHTHQLTQGGRIRRTVRRLLGRLGRR